jgi:pimeloyl-ACP methyl ester carboxylesterase
MEGIRAFHELAAFYLCAPLFQRVGGDGHPVLVLPGLLAGDDSTRRLRRYLDSAGFDAHGWLQGRNYGLRPGVEKRLVERVRELKRASGRTVSLVGWSLGGLYARQLAKMLPDDVRSVITLGSPFAGDPKCTNAWRIYQAFNGRSGRVELSHHAGPLSEAPPVPTTAIFSRSDGVCAWEACRETPGPRAESIEVYGSHLGLGHNPTVLHAISDRLAQPEGAWQPFERQGLLAAVYPR